MAMLVSGFGLELEGAVSMFWLKILGSPEVISWLLAGVPILLCSVWSGKRSVARWSSSCPLTLTLKKLFSVEKDHTLNLPSRFLSKGEPG